MYVSLVSWLPADLNEFSTTCDLMQGQVLYRRGEEALNVYLVEQGRLRLYSLDAEGRSVPLYVVRPNECVSEAALFADVYCGTVKAEIRSRVRGFPKHRLLEALRKNPELSERYMAEMARRFNSLRVRLELRNLRSARERVLQYLIAAAPVGGDTVLIDRPLKSVADDLGLSPESFYRALAVLASERLLSRNKRSVRLHRIPHGLSLCASPHRSMKVNSARS
jgi:CRP-like cAMP-binding protein